MESLLASVVSFIDTSEDNHIRIIDKSGSDTILYTDGHEDANAFPLDGITTNLNFADREWQIQCYAHKADLLTTSTQLFLLLAIIICITFSTMLLFVFTKRYFKARKQASLGHMMLQNSNALVKNMATNSKAILMSITDPLILFDREGRITGANTYALTRTGYTSRDINSSVDLFVRNVISIAREPNDLSSVVIEPGMREVTITCKDGTQFYAEANFSAQTVVGSNYAQVVTFRDISTKKQAAIDLWNAKKDAEIANKSKGDILLYLCHEIRNPVHAISGYARLLMEQKEISHSSEELENILSSAKFLSELVNEVLDLANLKNNDLVLKEKCIDLDYLLTLLKCSFTSIEGRNYHINTIIEGLGDVKILCDSSRLQSVIHRLGYLILDSPIFEEQNAEAEITLKMTTVSDVDGYLKQMAQ
ncbi:Enoyl-[acyl-carrier-protein] reductase [NADPH, B-specific] 2, mitochondrial [Basidiobolus ranarum]|uniref:histidine kinase n=1 Tax=Basidiobolus ranarum TaxID=34480 RepID=A0ABR2VJL6_9FUNG